jgi:hypothetical protein
MGEAASQGSLLLGRESELGVRDQLLDDVHARGGCLEVTGGPGVGKSALLGEAAAAQAPGSSPPTPAGARPILNASITHAPCVQRTRSWNGSARPSPTAIFSLTARRRCRACSVLTGHPSEECVPTGFLMPPRLDRRHR